jgi:hypothetical protein
MTEEETIQTLARVHGLSEGLVNSTTEIERVVERCSGIDVAALPAMHQTIVLAKGIYDLRKLMTEEIVNKIFMPLQGTKLGFRTDQDAKDGYAWQVVRDVVVEAVLRGFRPVGNEFNIIGGNFYATQEGLDRRVREFPGLTNLSLLPGVPVLKDGNALVAYEASWLLNGVPDHLSCSVTKNGDGELFDQRIPVRVNGGQGADAILGKAKRKMLARIFERISGVSVADGDVDSAAERLQGGPTPAPAAPAQDGRRISMKGGKKEPEAVPAERQREPEED